MIVVGLEKFFLMDVAIILFLLHSQEYLHKTCNFPVVVDDVSQELLADLFVENFFGSKSATETRRVGFTKLLRDEF